MTKISRTAGRIVASATALFLICGGAAHAATEPAVPGSSDVMPSPSTSDAQAQEWEYYDWYWNIFTCASARNSLISNGYVQDAICLPNLSPIPAMYDLYVLR